MSCEKHYTAFIQSDFAISNIEVTEQIWPDGSQYCGYVEKPRKNSGFVILCADIEAYFEVHLGKRVVAKMGDIVFVPKGCRYKVLFSNENNLKCVSSYTVNFNAYNAQGAEIAPDSELSVFAADRHSVIENYAAELCAVQHDVMQNRLKLNAKFYALLDAIISEKAKRNKDYYPIRRGVEMLNRNWNSNIRIAEYAAECNMSESYFYKLFNIWAGVSPVEYRNRIRISHAKTLLRNGSAQIGEISQYVGFTDPLYFSRIFKKTVGVSPSRYKLEG